MAKDGIHIQFKGGAKLDLALTKIANVKQSKASTIVNNTVKTASTELKRQIKAVTPQSSSGSTGRDGSRGAKTKVHGHTKGTLKT